MRARVGLRGERSAGGRVWALSRHLSVETMKTNPATVRETNPKADVGPDDKVTLRILGISRGVTEIPLANFMCVLALKSVRNPHNQARRSRP